jgi:hypothetical protein
VFAINFHKQQMELILFRCTRKSRCNLAVWAVDTAGARALCRVWGSTTDNGYYVNCETIPHSCVGHRSSVPWFRIDSSRALCRSNFAETSAFARLRQKEGLTGIAGQA